MRIFKKKNIENLSYSIEKKRAVLGILAVIIVLTILVTISIVNAESPQENNDYQSILNTPHNQNLEAMNNSNDGINFLGNKIDANNVVRDSMSDPRLSSDTPNPNDPENIAKFRVKDTSETDEEIKQRLTDNDVYRQIQNYKLEGETVYVSTPNELIGALWGLDRPYDKKLPGGSNSNPYLKNPLKNISRIVLTKDISIRQYQPLTGYQDFNDMRAVTLGNIPDRNIVIDGKDPNTGVIHTLDMCNRITSKAGYADTRISLENNYSSVFVMNNIHLSGVDYYGPVSAYTATAPKQIIYRNITYTGAQLVASYSTNVTFTGSNNVRCATQYQTLEPYDTGAKDSNENIIYDAKPGAIYYAEGNVPSTATGRVSNYYSEEIMECANVTFAYNSIFDGYSATTAPFRLGFGVSAGITPKADVMDHAQIILESTNKGQRDKTGETGMIQMRNGTFDLHPHSKLVLNAHDYVPDSSGDTSNGNKPNVASSRDLIGLYGTKAVLKIGDYASVEGTQNGKVALKVPGSVYLDPGSSLEIGRWGKLKIKSTNAGTSNKPVLRMSDRAQIKVQPSGSFDLQGDGDYTGNRSLIQLGRNTIFQFDRARMVNMQYNGTSQKTNLLSMNVGKMNVKNMDIYAWNFGNKAVVETDSDSFDNIEGSDYIWHSAYNFEANYNNLGFLNLDDTTTSLFPNELADMKKNYNTNNFQRVMFHYIPAVYAKFTSQPVDDPNNENSYKISGETYTDNVNDPDGSYLPLPNAYIRLKGHVKNTAAAPEVGIIDLDQPFENVTPPDERWGSDQLASEIDLTSNFSAISDKQGKFTVTLPKNSNQKTFMASDPNDTENKNPGENGRIQAFVFKSGNFTNTDIAVLDKTNPIAKSTSMKNMIIGNKAPDPKSFVDTDVDAATGLTKITDLHPDIHSNAFTRLSDYKFEFGDQNLATDSTFWATEGIKDVYVNVIDPSGNKTVVKSKVKISKTPVFIEINKPNAIFKMPFESTNWSDEQWQEWVTNNNPNEVRAIKINADGTKTDISTKITNNAHAFGQKVNEIIYTVKIDDSTEITEKATIEFKSDTIQLKLPLDSGNNPKGIDFGHHSIYHTGYISSNLTMSYPIEVVDDRISKMNNWQLELKASKFEDQTNNSASLVLPKNIISLGLLDSTSNVFSEIVDTSAIISEGVENKNIDILSGVGLINSNQKLNISLSNLDNRLSEGKYKSKLTWTVVDKIP